MTAKLPEISKTNYFKTNILFILICISPICSSQSTPTICQQIITAVQNNNNTQLQSYLARLQDIRYDACLIQLTPKYYWAQNMSHIMVKFQFVNSADTSACEQVLTTNKTITHNYFSITLICLQSALVIRYRLTVHTFMPLNYYQAVWKQGEQNSITLICMKSPNPYFWKTLYSDSQIPQRKPKIWWKIMEKYKDNLKDFIYDLEIEGQQHDISNHVKSRKQIKIRQQSEHLNPDSEIYLYCNQNNPFQMGSWLN